MSIGRVNVSFGQQTQVKPQSGKRETSVLKGTAVAAGVGAVVNGTYSVLKLSHAAKNDSEFLTLLLGKYPRTKVFAISGLMGAVVVGGAYLAYRGIKALFSSK